MISFTLLVGSGPIPTPTIGECMLKYTLTYLFICYIMECHHPRSSVTTFGTFLMFDTYRENELLLDGRLLPKLEPVTAGPNAKSKQVTSSREP